jgi:serine/threonine protein kinase
MSTNSSTNNSDNEEDSSIDWTLNIFNDRYIAIKKLGKGSYCSVWLAYNQKLNKMQALKIYNREDYHRAKREIKVFDELKKINIENIITYIDKFIYEDEEYDSNDEDSDSDASEFNTNRFQCVTMQLCGYSLSDLINIYKNTDENIPIKLIAYIHDMVVDILKKLHDTGLVHTDIKPENILLDIPRYDILNFINLEKSLKNKKRKEIINKLQNELKNNLVYDVSNVIEYLSNGLEKYFNVYLCDMGTTMKPGDPTIYKKHTLYYRSPESILQIGWDYTYDYWSLGCTLYELLTKNILFDVEDDLELLYDIQTKFGILPTEFIEKSPIKRRFYNSNLKILRGYKKIKYIDVFETLLIDNHTDDVMYELYKKTVQSINMYLSYNTNERIAKRFLAQ